MHPQPHFLHSLHFWECAQWVSQGSVPLLCQVRTPGKAEHDELKEFVKPSFLSAAPQNWIQQYSWVTSSLTVSSE